MSPNWTLSRPRLRLDVRYMNITYRGSRQAVLSDSDVQLNKLDLVTNTQRAFARVQEDCTSVSGFPYCTVFWTYPQA